MIGGEIAGKLSPILVFSYLECYPDLGQMLLLHVTYGKEFMRFTWFMVASKNDLIGGE